MFSTLPDEMCYGRCLLESMVTPAPWALVTMVLFLIRFPAGTHFITEADFILLAGIVMISGLMTCTSWRRIWSRSPNARASNRPIFI